MNKYNYTIYVPTYNRTTIPALQMLNKDKQLSITLCIRRGTESMYQSFKNKYRNRLQFLILDDVHDIGDTRAAILDYSNQHDDYCIMFDDCIDDVKIEDVKICISDIIDYCIQFLSEKQRYFEPDIIAYTFFREGNRFVGVDPYDYILVGCPLQAFIIDNKVAVKHNVNFKSMDIVGLEDIAFLIDAMKEDCVTVSMQHVSIVGKLPNVQVKGGNHEVDENFELKRDKSHAILEKYIGDMYGVMYTKKYRRTLNQIVTYCVLDYSYFRDVLVIHRKQNEEIRKNKFMRYKHD